MTGHITDERRAELRKKPEKRLTLPEPPKTVEGAKQGVLGKEGLSAPTGLKMLSTARISSGKTKTKRRHPEGDLQIACVKYFGYAFPRYKNNLIAIPNQLVRRGTNAQFLSAQGVKAGTPDLLLAIPRSQYHSLFIEMKAPDGKLSQRQKEMIQVLTSEGFLCEVCYSFDQFKNIIENYLR